VNDGMHRVFGSGLVQHFTVEQFLEIHDIHTKHFCTASLIRSMLQSS